MSDFRRVKTQLDRWGLLLLHDGKLPSITGIVAREPVRGSWWGHPKGEAIYRICTKLEDEDAVLSVKLINGKVTYVHERLLAALVAVARAREDWQLDGLSRPARRLLRRVDAEKQAFGTGKPGLELEKRLLAHGQSVHTESGAHARALIDWAVVARAAGVSLRQRSVSRARAKLEAAVEEINAEANGKARLPWQ